jgi:hypothetical protein
MGLGQASEWVTPPHSGSRSSAAALTFAVSISEALSGETIKKGMQLICEEDVNPSRIVSASRYAWGLRQRRTQVYLMILL